MRPITAIEILTDFEELAKDPERYYKVRAIARLRYTPAVLMMEMPYDQRIAHTNENDEFEKHFGKQTL